MCGNCLLHGLVLSHVTPFNVHSHLYMGQGLPVIKAREHVALREGGWGDALWEGGWGGALWEGSWGDALPGKSRASIRFHLVHSEDFSLNSRGQ